MGLLVSLAASMGLAACGGGNDGTGEGEKFQDSVAPTAAAADSMDVIFQLTGMVLVVPPKNSSEQTHLLLPNAQGHLAYFGIGYAPRDTALCAKQRPGICYVDLEKWRVDPLGPRGEPTDFKNVGTPRRVLNVTRAAGPNYRAKVQATKGGARAHLTFLTGHARGDVCSLATWTYKPVTTAQVETDTFANVMSWVMRYPRDEPFRVRFVLKTDTTKVRVITLDTSLDSVNLAIAHVTPADTAFLPAPMEPKMAHAAVQEPPRLDHIHHYYGLLRHRANDSVPGASNRPVPELVDTLTNPTCPVSVTPVSATGPEMLAPEVAFGVKTYGCVVGTGGG